MTEDVNQLLFLGDGPMAKAGAYAIKEIQLNKIKTGRNSRGHVSKDSLAGMMQSIKETGLLQPIGVVKSGTGYEICYGNQRFLACSKLGWSKIPCVVYENQSAADLDLKNLVENIQRKNVGVVEAGRYMQLLRDQKLSNEEIAVRLGVQKQYITDCLRAYADVPKAFQKDVITTVGSKTASRTAGKIPVYVATKIIAAKKSLRLTNTQTEKLFEAARSDERFRYTNTLKYAAKVKHGAKDPIGDVVPTTVCRCDFTVTEEHRDELMEKYVTSGPFKSLNALFTAILEGKKAVRVQVVHNDKD